MLLEYSQYENLLSGTNLAWKPRASQILFIPRKDLQCQYLIPTLNAGQPQAKYTTTRPIANQFHGY